MKPGFQEILSPEPGVFLTPTRGAMWRYVADSCCFRVLVSQTLVYVLSSAHKNEIDFNLAQLKLKVETSFI